MASIENLGRDIPTGQTHPFYSTIRLSCFTRSSSAVYSIIPATARDLYHHPILCPISANVVCSTRKLTLKTTITCLCTVSPTHKFIASFKYNSSRTPVSSPTQLSSDHNRFSHTFLWFTDMSCSNTSFDMHLLFSSATDESIKILHAEYQPNQLLPSPSIALPDHQLACRCKPSLRSSLSMVAGRFLAFFVFATCPILPYLKLLCL